MSFVFEDAFITEDKVNRYKRMSNDKIKTMLYAEITKNINILFDVFPDFLLGKKESSDFEELPEGSINALNDVKKKIKQINFREYGFPESDIDVLLEQLREENFTKYCRHGKWKRSFTKVLNNNGKINEYETWTAIFGYINKWNQESELQEYKILINYENKILWIGIDKKYHFISAEDNIYGFKYKNMNIILFPNICTIDEYFSDDDMNINDQLILKYRENIIKKENVTFDNAKNILLEEKKGVQIPIDKYFNKEFFYKGFKWNKYYKNIYPKTATILISIQSKKKLFYIEIENITYPLYGYFLLDLNKIRIVEANKSGKISFIDKIKALYNNWISNNHIYLNREINRVLSQNDIDTMLETLHGSLINRIKMIKKRINLFLRNVLEYKLIVIRNKLVYIIGMDGFKKELRKDSYYSFIFDNYINNGGN